MKKTRFVSLLLFFILIVFCCNISYIPKTVSSINITLQTEKKTQEITLPEYKSSNIHIVLEALKDFGYSKTLNEKLKIVERINLTGLPLKNSFNLVFPSISKKLDKLFKSVNFPAKNAKVKFYPKTEEFVFTREQIGKSLNEDDFYSQLFCGLKNYENNNGKIEIIPITLLPETYLKDIEDSIYKGVSFSTSFDGTKVERAHNIKTALSSINGMKIEPNEIFSFNLATGKRTKSNGYEEAKIISGGVFVKGAGGGVCQVSTTLFNAALLNGLEVKESSAHTFPAHYVKLGQDAMVSHNSSDLKIRNPFKTPVFIKTEFLENSIRITFFGAELKSSYRLETIIVEKLEIPKPKTVKNEKNKYSEFFEKTDAQIVKVRNGYKGYKTETYLIETMPDGTILRKLIRKDFYKPFSELWVER